MKALFVGDNRYGPNWGGRGASIALYQLISREFDVSGVIPGTTFHLGGGGAGYVNTFLGGTPCLFLGTTAHKMTSLQRLLDYPETKTFSACPSDEEIEDIVALAQTSLASSEAQRQRIRSAASTRYEHAVRLPDLLRSRIEHAAPGDQSPARIAPVSQYATAS